MVNLACEGKYVGTKAVRHIICHLIDTMIRLQTLRQLFIISGLVLCSISDGFIFGQMSGMVDALLGNDGEITLSASDVSWIASIINATCICGFGLVALLAEKVGRRRIITILTVPVLASYIMIYYGRDMATFIMSRVIVGISYGGVLVLTYIAMTEYTTPNKRAFCVNFISSIGPSVGTSSGHILSILLHWRTVALIGLIPTGLSALLPFFWVESPSWLATQGRFEEGKKAFREIHIRNKESEAELRLLVETERRKRNEISSDKRHIAFVIAKLEKAIKQKYFWNIFILGSVIAIYRVAAGRLLFSTLAITMLQEITGTSNILLFTLIVDGFIILGSIFSFVSLSKIKMRPLLFSLGLLGNFTLLILSACLYFIPRDIWYHSWVNISLLAFYLVTVYTGPYAVLEVYLSEIFPLEIKSYYLLFLSFISSISAFLSVYLVPTMSTKIGYHGIFSVYACIVFMCLAYLWYFMPETKGRTLQEIEIYFKKNKFEDSDEVSNEHSIGLL